jgi:hypothetical protein
MQDGCSFQEEDADSWLLVGLPNIVEMPPLQADMELLRSAYVHANHNLATPLDHYSVPLTLALTLALTPALTMAVAVAVAPALDRAADIVPDPTADLAGLAMESLVKPSEDTD